MTLKAARVNAGYSQKAAAAELGISNKTLCSWEKGTSKPKADKIENICTLYGVSYECINFLHECSL